MKYIDLKTVLSTSFLAGALLVGGLFLYEQVQAPSQRVVRENFVSNTSDVDQANQLLPTATPTISPTPAISVATPPQSAEITIPSHSYQTFNNCGPATLSMYYSSLGLSISQQELGNKLRPYQNPQGDNDDKSVTLEELAEDARERGYITFHRPNGSIDLLQQFIANDIPVLVRTWLNPGEDIGHYRVVRGYTDFGSGDGEILQDDSYHGPDLTYSYDSFMNMWKPFNYEYLVVVTEEEQQLAQNILQTNANIESAWQSTLERAQNETGPYATFNQAVANYHLGNYEQTINLYNSVAGQLPGRMLWYQIEPIQAHADLGNAEMVISMTDAILNNGNRAFSELYMLRGQVFEQEGRIQEARQQYELALQYNQNFDEAREALNELSSN